jgi:guanylate kinase
MSGKLIIFSAPSGAGKTTIVRNILAEYPDLFAFSISATTRPKRPQETHSKDYFFLSTEEFQQKIAENAFVEWEMVYVDCYYGTLKSEVERCLNAGSNMLFDIDVKGGLNIKKLYGDKALSLFIAPPSIEILRERLIARNTETAETLQKRIAKAEYEFSFANQFDKIIVNECLENAIEDAKKAIFGFLSAPE